MYVSAAIDQFFNDLKQHHVPSHTLKNYTLWLKRFLDFCLPEDKTNDLDVLSIDEALIKKYKAYLSQLELKKVTQNYHLIALRSFLDYLKKQKVETFSSKEVKLNHHEKREINILSLEEIRKIVESPDTSKKEGIRDRIILELLSCTNLSASELITLNRNLKDFQLSLSASKWLEIYLLSRKDTFTPLFIRYQGMVDPNHGGEKMRLTERSIERIVEKYAKKVGLVATPHDLMAK